MGCSVADSRRKYRAFSHHAVQQHEQRQNWECQDGLCGVGLGQLSNDPSAAAPLMHGRKHDMKDTRVQGVRWGCQESHHNDLATAFWSTPDDLLSRLFSVGHEDTMIETLDETGFTQQSLLLYSLIYLSMLALCAGVCVPAGMFMPAVMLGAATGLAAGVQLQHLLPKYHIQPGMPSVDRFTACSIA